MSKQVKVIYLRGIATASPGQDVQSAYEYGEIVVASVKGNICAGIRVDIDARTMSVDFGAYCEIWPTENGETIRDLIAGIERLVSEVGQSKVVFNQVIGKPSAWGGQQQWFSTERSFADSFKEYRSRYGV